MPRPFARTAAPCALAMLLYSACAAQESAPGRLSLLRHVGRPEGVELTNLTYTLLQEKVLKVHAVTLAPTQGGLGERRYAGSFTVGTGAQGKPWLFEAPAEQRTASAAQKGPLQAEVTLNGKGDGWTCDETAHFSVGYPAVWLKLRASGSALPLRGALMGWGWVPGRTPESWWTPGGQRERPAGTELKLAGKDCPVLAWNDAAHGWSGALAFTTQPSEVVINDDGIRFDYPDGVAEANMAYLVSVPGVAGGSARAGLEALPAPPANYRLDYGAGAQGPWVEYANDSATTGTLTFASPKGASLPLASGLAGRLWLGAAPRERVSLTERPGFDQPVPELKPLPPPVRDRVAALVKELIARQEPDGRYTYGQDRGFWDGITATILAQALPLLPDADRPAATASVK
ncbi:MAG: hypothetical protein HYU66_23425, partial [Armatimonadetes bacterium]|nr:hypothetical protein [Armatimonadota bacterium]